VSKAIGDREVPMGTWEFGRANRVLIRGGPRFAGRSAPFQPAEVHIFPGEVS